MKHAESFWINSEVIATNILWCFSNKAGKHNQDTKNIPLSPDDAYLAISSSDITVIWKPENVLLGI